MINAQVQVDQKCRFRCIDLSHASSRFLPVSCRLQLCCKKQCQCPDWCALICLIVLVYKFQQFEIIEKMKHEIEAGSLKDIKAGSIKDIKAGSFKDIKVPRYSDKFKDVLERALKREETIQEVKTQPKDLFFYRVKSTGVGAFSFVYLVAQENSCSLFAQKSICKNKIMPELFNEIKLHLSLTHPNIISLYHIYAEEEYLHLIMEYAGESLFSLRQNQKMPAVLPAERVLHIVYQISKALEYLEQRGVVHGDIKLENILELQGVIKVCDFGFAHRLQEPHKEIVGTLEYLAPEYVQGKKSGYNRDVWALGIICYELSLGRNPIQGVPQNQKWSKMISIQQINVEEVRQQVSPSIYQFLSSTLCPYHRRLSASQLLKLEFFKQQQSLYTSHSNSEIDLSFQ